MQQLSQYMTRKNIPDRVYYAAPSPKRRYFDYLLGMIKLMQLPTFDAVHNVKYEAVPGQWAKGWQIISKLTPDKELRFYIKSSVASPDNPFYRNVFRVPTRVYENFIDAKIFGFGEAYLSYPKEQENNLNDTDKWLKALSDNCIQCLTDVSERQVKSGQTQNECLQEFGYPHLGNRNQELFDRLNDARGVGVEEIVPIINMMHIITSWYGKTYNS